MVGPGKAQPTQMHQSLISAQEEKDPFPLGGFLEWNLALICELMLGKCTRSAVAQYFGCGLWSQPAWIQISTYTLFCSPVKGAS